MGGFFKRFGKLATKIESWWALVLLVTSSGAFAWLGQQWDMLASQGWAAVTIVAIMAASFLVIAVALAYQAISRIRGHVVGGAPGEPAADLYSYDAAEQARDRDAYYELMAFSVNYLLPACDYQLELQKEIVRQLCKSEAATELAIRGLQDGHQPETRDFWTHYDNLVRGVDSSEPIIRFGAMLDCIQGLERQQNYRKFCAQADVIAKSGGLDYRTDEVLRPKWEAWRDAHNALVREYDTKIKKDVRFGKLFRPRRESRWGEIIS